MPDEATGPADRERLLARAIGRWDTDGGAGAGAGLPEMQPDTPPLTNAEIVQLQVRVIALENVLTVLLAEASDRQLTLVREIASYIAPRPGFTPHRLTVHAAARITSLVDRAAYLQALRAAGHDADIARGGADHADGR